ncbi:ArsR/SmtB family transcription factor [Roseibium aggregatum]|jgi:ArsR family transcriptional regulator|uniref:ArsR/SmtB family transcription factor n=1 Tax=Roseibium aggregatum TaxID=187304 RepID=UPI003A978EC2
MNGTDLPAGGNSKDETEDLASCEDLAAIFRALGHPARLAIIKQLASRKGACCGEIVSHLPLAQSTVSQHLQVLKDAGLLFCDTRGRNCHYALNWQMLSLAGCRTRDFWERLNAAQPEEAEQPAGTLPVSATD